MQVSLIVTILNEEKTIEQLLGSVLRQTRKPNELIIVDGGSTDRTLQLIEVWQKEHKSINLVILKKIGNRSIGRNFAIEKAKYDWIAVTDAGCILEKDWLTNLVECQKKSLAQVIAGYYRGVAETNFQQAVIPYALVMPDRVTPNDFLPATRSMMLHKDIWKKLGGFDQKLSDNEDYAFAHKIKEEKIQMKFCQSAVAYWIPRSDIISFLKMIYRFAKGDAYAGIWRPKVLFIFIRYALVFCILYFVYSIKSSESLVGILVLLFGVYSIWSIKKNIRYVPSGWYYLPILQISSDLAVMGGSVVGLFTRLNLP